MAHCSLFLFSSLASAACVLASLALYNTVPSSELRPRVVEALLMLPSQALLLLCHLDNDLVNIIYTAKDIRYGLY